MAGRANSAPAERLDDTAGAAVETIDLRGVDEPYAADVLRRRMVASIDARPDWRDSTTRIAVLVVAMVAGGLLVASGSAVAAIAGVAILSLVAASLIAAQHEALHRALFAHRRANDAVGVVMSLFTLIHHSGYRAYHLHHHAHTHAPGDSEPVLVYRSIPGWAASVVGAFHYIRVVSLRWAFTAARGRGRAAVRLGVASTVALVVAVAGLAALAVSDPRAFLLLWLVPTIVGTAIQGFIALAEHYGCDYGPDDAVRTTRTVVSNRFVRFLTWNTNYHAEHHWAPTIPTSRLPELHELLSVHVTHRERGYLRFHTALVRDLAHRRRVAGPPWGDGAPEPTPPGQRG